MGKLFKQEGIQLKIASGSPRNWTDSLGLLPDKAVKAAKKSFRLNQLPEESETAELPGKGSDQLRFRKWYSPTSWTAWGLGSVLQVPSFCELSHRLGRALVISCLWDISIPIGNLLPILYIIPIKLNGSPDWILVVSVLWSVVGSLSVMNKHVCYKVPGKVLSHNNWPHTVVLFTYIIYLPQRLCLARYCTEGQTHRRQKQIT